MQKSCFFFYKLNGCKKKTAFLQKFIFVKKAAFLCKKKTCFFYKIYICGRKLPFFVKILLF